MEIIRKTETTHILTFRMSDSEASRLRNILVSASDSLTMGPEAHEIANNVIAALPVAGTKKPVT